jgi:hypothetical protein
MPSKDNVAKKRVGLWLICAKADKPKRWNLSIPFCEFEERRRNSSDPVFRPEDFEGRKKGVYDKEASGLGKGGMDLLGRYRFDNSMVTIYVDSCRKVEQWCDVPLDQLLHVVLVHELAHLMTHRGFGAQESLSPHFWEYTAQCATYAYLHRHNAKALKVFEKLSPYQPFYISDLGKSGNSACSFRRQIRSVGQRRFQRICKGVAGSAGGRNRKHALGKRLRRVITIRPQYCTASAYLEDRNRCRFSRSQGLPECVLAGYSCFADRPAIL